MNWLDRAEILLSRLPIKNRQTHRMNAFTLYRNQKILMEKMKKQWNDEGKLRIIILKARRTGMCLDPQTCVLTSDLRWVPIADLGIGESVVSVDDEGRKGRGLGRKMRLAVVEAKNKRRSSGFILRMANGQTLRATGEHRFLFRVRGGTKCIWQYVSKMRPGDTIRSITTPWNNPGSFEHGWFGGQTRPVRLMDKDWWQNKELPGKRTGTGWTSICSIEPMPEQEMIDIQTSTGTFIADGFVSHNSSLVDGILWCYGMAFPNKNIKILAHLSGTSDELFRVPVDLSKAFPDFHSKDIQQRRITFRHKEGDSQITLATAGTPEAGRGGTFSALHLSEAAKYPDEGIFTSMVTAVSKGPESIVVIESTANGREGVGRPFFEYWENAVKGVNGYIPVFLSWLDDPAFSLPGEGAEDAPDSDLEKELMAAPFSATKNQIAWMRSTKASDCQDLEHVWLTEYPHASRVAFQVSGEPAFARDELAYAETTIREPLCRGRFLRNSAAQGFRFVKSDDGPLFVWRFPFDKNGKSDGMKYYIGADSAAGVECGDFAAYTVLCGQTGELAARFAERVDPDTLAAQLDMAGRWYNMAMVNPELTGGLGRWTLVKLRDVFRYPNICRWKGRFDRKRGKDSSNALGFEMNNATRRLIIDATRSGLRMGIKGEPGGLRVNDRALMTQLDLCTLKEWRWEVCFPPDVQVLANPGYGKISNMKSGKCVVSHTGELRKISRVFRRGYSGLLMSLKVSGQNRRIRLTPNHPIYTRRFAWNKQNVKRGNSRIRTSYPPVFSPSALARPGDYVFVPKRKGLKDVQFNADHLRVMGWYLAQGHLRGKSGRMVAFSVHEKELEQLQEISSILTKYDPPSRIVLHITRKATGKSYQWTKDRKPPRVRTIKGTGARGIQLIYWSEYWSRIFREHCGCGSRSKELSGELFGSRNLLPFVRAWIEGDGCQSRSKYHQQGVLSVSTSSSRLALQMRQILIDHGIWCSVCEPKTQEIFRIAIPSEYAERFGPGYKIKPIARRFSRREVIEDDDGFWTPIREVSKESYNGEVFNLEVTDEHTYVADGIAVHNCREHDDILVAYAISCLTREQFPPARMSFAPKSIMEPPTMQEKLQNMGVGNVKSESELPGMFQAEMRRVMRQAGLNSSMRGTGRRHINRLQGI